MQRDTSRAVNIRRLASFDWSDIPRPTSDVCEALSALELVTKRLGAIGHHHAAFPEIYGVITGKVAFDVTTDRRVFLEPQWISRLAGKFCARYLDTLERALTGKAQDCEAWSVAYERAPGEQTVPAEAVVLGLSAHINYDLAIGIAQNIEAFGHAHDPRMLARYKRDHDAVNALLEASIEESFERLVYHHACGLSAFVRHRMYSLARKIIMQALTRWRSRVWNDAMALLKAAGARERAAILRRMDRRAGWLGRRIRFLGALWARRAGALATGAMGAASASTVVLYI